MEYRPIATTVLNVYKISDQGGGGVMFEINNFESVTMSPFNPLSTLVTVIIKTCNIF